VDDQSPSEFVQKNNGKEMKFSNIWFFARVCLRLVVLFFLCIGNLFGADVDEKTVLQESIRTRIQALTPSHKIAEVTPSPQIDVSGYSLYQVFHDSETVLDTESALGLGDEIGLELYVEIYDRLDTDHTVLSVGLGGAAHSVSLKQFAGSNDVQIGGVYKKNLEIPFFVLPDPERHLPFFNGRTYPVSLTVSDSLGNSILSKKLLDVKLLPLVKPGVVCLTNNLDIPEMNRVNQVESIEFPNGKPVMHDSGTGDIKVELADGIFTGSGVPEWETVYWSGDWDNKTRTIDYYFFDVNQIDAVVLIFTSPYGDNWIDTLEVEVSLDGQVFVPVNKPVVAFPDKNVRGLHAMIVQHIDKQAQQVRLKMLQNAGAMRIPVSEIYIFGN